MWRCASVKSGQWRYRWWNKRGENWRSSSKNTYSYSSHDATRFHETPPCPINNHLMSTHQICDASVQNGRLGNMGKIAMFTTDVGVTADKLLIDECTILVNWLRNDFQSKKTVKSSKPSPVSLRSWLKLSIYYIKSCRLFCCLSNHLLNSVMSRLTVDKCPLNELPFGYQMPCPLLPHLNDANYWTKLDQTWWLSSKRYKTL